LKKIIDGRETKKIPEKKENEEREGSVNRKGERRGEAPPSRAA